MRFGGTLSRGSSAGVVQLAARGDEVGEPVKLGFGIGG